MLLNPLYLMDMQNLFTFTKKPVGLKWKCEDYTILIPVHKRYLDKNLRDQLKGKENKTIIVDDSNGYELMKDYLSNLKKEGFRVIKSENPGFKWGALKNTLRYIVTKYTLFLDDDTYSRKDFGFLVGVLEEKSADISSVKVFPSNTKTIIERLQDIEYRIAMLSRQNRNWITSGACICAKTESIKIILENHSGFREGGDIEIGLIAKKLKMKYIHTDFEVFTEVPSNFTGWFSQRYKWMGGNFRHTTMNLFSGGRDVIYLSYFFIFVWTHILVRYFLMIEYPLIFGMTVLIYIPLTFIANCKIGRTIWRKELIIFPIYALFQTMFISIFGIGWYIKSAIEQKNFGFISIKKTMQKTKPKNLSSIFIYKSYG